MPPSLFSRIIAGDLPAHIIGQDERFIAFLDIAPMREGHTLVVPKKEIDYLFDLPDSILGALLVFAKDVSRRLHLAVPCKRIGVAVVGFEVPHAHVHLVPINKVSDMDFSLPKSPATEEALVACAARIRAIP